MLILRRSRMCRWRSETATIVAISHHTKGFLQIQEELNPEKIQSVVDTPEMCCCPHMAAGGGAMRSAEGACVLLRLIPRLVRSQSSGRCLPCRIRKLTNAHIVARHPHPNQRQTPMGGQHRRWPIDSMEGVATAECRCAGVEKCEGEQAP